MKTPSHKKVSLSKLLPKMGKQSSSPGTIKYIGKQRDTPVGINLFNYNETSVTEKKI